MAPSSTDQERLEDFFWNLERIMPNPPRDWAKTARPCKWDRILKERRNKLSDGAG